MESLNFNKLPEIVCFRKKNISFKRQNADEQSGEKMFLALHRIMLVNESKVGDSNLMSSVDNAVSAMLSEPFWVRGNNVVLVKFAADG